MQCFAQRGVSSMALPQTIIWALFASVLSVLQDYGQLEQQLFGNFRYFEFKQ
jgi:hypothetical protein